MLGSFLIGGAQALDVAEHAAGSADLVYGQSVTDACMDWDVTALVFGPACGVSAQPADPRIAETQPGGVFPMPVPDTPGHLYHIGIISP